MRNAIKLFAVLTVLIWSASRADAAFTVTVTVDGSAAAFVIDDQGAVGSNQFADNATPLAGLISSTFSYQGVTFSISASTTLNSSGVSVTQNTLEISGSGGPIGIITVQVENTGLNIPPGGTPVGTSLLVGNTLGVSAIALGATISGYSYLNANTAGNQTAAVTTSVTNPTPNHTQANLTTTAQPFTLGNFFTVSNLNPGGSISATLTTSADENAGDTAVSPAPQGLMLALASFPVLCVAGLVYRRRNQTLGLSLGA